MASSSKNQKSSKQIKAEHYDLVVIGGGISGATVFYDASLRGLKALLVEKNDFASGTSQATSRLIHGGLRYLKNLEFKMVRESLRERKILAQIAPHAISPRSFFFPMYKNKKPSLLLMKAGLFLYDLLSLSRNRGICQDHIIPRFRSLNKSEALAFDPGTKKTGMMGAVFYYDYANHNPERLCYEFIHEGKKRGGVAYNYTKVENISYTDGKYNIQISPQQGSNKQIKNTIIAQSVVNAAGPWADIVNKLIQKKNQSQHIIRSMGIHIVTRKISGNSTVILLRPDGSHLFILPMNGRSLIGTTDKIFKEHPDSFYVKQTYIKELIRDVNRAYPGANLQVEDVQYFYGGLRPLVEQDSSSTTYNASRKVEIEHHKGLPGFFTVLGGKYTTSRKLAQDTIDKVIQQISGSFNTCKTDVLPLPGGRYRNFTKLLKELSLNHPKTDSLKIWNLAKRYGALAHTVLEQKVSQKNTGFKASNGEIFYEEEITWICKHEDVVYLDDVVFRRTSIGIYGQMENTQLQKLANHVGQLKHWDKPFINKQIEKIKDIYNICK